MTGTLALIGGGEFEATEELDRELLECAGSSAALVLPTADVLNIPSAPSLGPRTGSEARRIGPRPACARAADALVPEHVAAVAESPLTYLVGDSPMHLRSVLKDTPLWDALVSRRWPPAVLWRRRVRRRWRCAIP